MRDTRIVHRYTYLRAYLCQNGIRIRYIIANIVRNALILRWSYEKKKKNDECKYNPPVL